MSQVFLIEVVGTLAVISQMIRIFPQVIKGFITKQVKDVSLWWEIIAFCSAGLWFTYGLLTNDLALIVGNIITLFAFTLLLYQKFTY